jgi:hypothetical protein
VLGEAVPAFEFEFAAPAGSLGAALNLESRPLAVAGAADQLDGEAVGAPDQLDETVGSAVDGAVDGAEEGAADATGGVLAAWAGATACVSDACEETAEPRSIADACGRLQPARPIATAAKASQFSRHTERL